MDKNIRYNNNVILNRKQTIPYLEWVNICNNDAFYNEVLNKIIDYISTNIENWEIKSNQKRVLERILSFYLLPQNHNNLTYGSLYQYDPDFRLFLSFFIRNKLVILVGYENNIHFIFSDKIEKLIKREYSLNILLNEKND